MPLHTQKNVKPRLLDQVRQTIRRKHYSLRTEATSIGWIKRYIFFHRKRHPKEMGAAEMEQFLNYLAVEKRVAASTQSAKVGVRKHKNNRARGVALMRSAPGY